MGLLDLINPISAVVSKVLDLIPDPNARAKAKEEADKQIADLIAGADADQRETNKIEAGSSSVFVAGWRPSIGWVCSISLALYYIPRFTLGMGFWCWACVKAQTLVPLPEMGIAEVIGLVMSLLGMGGLRTLEKRWGVTK